MSLPTRERGLKLLLIFMMMVNFCVAPHAGAWIETVSEWTRLMQHVSRSPRGSVD